MEDQAPSLGYWMEDQDQLEDHSNGLPEYTDVSDTLFAHLKGELGMPAVSAVLVCDRAHSIASL